jgi:hypothetical protein
MDGVVDDDDDDRDMPSSRFSGEQWYRPCACCSSSISETDALGDREFELPAALQPDVLETTSTTCLLPLSHS